MSVQQNVVSVTVPDEGAFERLRGAFDEGGTVRVDGVPAEDGGGWTVLVESHELGPEELHTVIESVLGPDAARLHQLSVVERLRFLAGNDPWANQARG